MSFRLMSQTRKRAHLSITREWSWGAEPEEA
jgi:hypothetical protein